MFPPGVITIIELLVIPANVPHGKPRRRTALLGKPSPEYLKWHVIFEAFEEEFTAWEDVDCTSSASPESTAISEQVNAFMITFFFAKAVGTTRRATMRIIAEERLMRTRTLRMLAPR